MKRPDRKEREAAALRANLLKRKEQTRRRDAVEAPVPSEAANSEGSANLPKDDTKHEE